MKMLVTGATGFIGARLAARLAKSGAEVHALVRAGRSVPWLAHVGDLREPASLAAAVEAAKPEVVFHLAKDREARSFEADLRGTVALAAALRGRKVLLVRTAHNAPRAADAKLAASLDVPNLTLELFQVYGPGQPDGHFPACLLTGRPCDAGGPKDFVYVDDVVEAYVLAAQRGKIGARYEIGSGRLTPPSEVARLLGRAAADGPGQGHAADLRAALELGWAPRTSLEAGLRKLAEALHV